MRRTPHLLEVSLTAKIFGWIALLLAIGAIVTFAVGMAMELAGAGEPENPGLSLQFAAVMIGLFAVNFFGTFSQILSDSREERGSRGIVLVWSAMPILVIVRVLLGWLTA